MNGNFIKTIWKRAEMVVLALALAVFSLLTACGGNKENNTVSDKWDKAGNKISEATVYEIASGEAGPDAGIMPLAADGNDTEVKTSSVTANAYDFRITPQGNVLYTLNESGTDENGETVDRNYLKGVDKTGTELFSLDIKSLMEGEETVAVQSVVFSPDNTFYLLTGQKIFEVDTGGNVVNKYDPPEGYKDLYNPAFYYKGEPVFTIWNYEGETSTVKSLIFDFKTGSVKKELDIPQNILNQYSVYPGMGSGYDLILSNSTGLYGYNPGETDPVPIMNYVASNLPISGFENVCFLNGKEFVCNYYDNVENKNRIAWMNLWTGRNPPVILIVRAFALCLRLHRSSRIPLTMINCMKITMHGPFRSSSSSPMHLC